MVVGIVGAGREERVQHHVDGGEYLTTFRSIVKVSLMGKGSA